MALGSSPPHEHPASRHLGAGPARGRRCAAVNLPGAGRVWATGPIPITFRDGVVETRINGQVLGVDEGQSPVVDRDSPPMHRRPHVPTTARVGHCRVVRDDLPDDVGRGAPANQLPDRPSTA